MDIEQTQKKTKEPRVLMVGPSATRARGGIQQVIEQLSSIPGYVVGQYEQFIDGSFITRMTYMFKAYLAFGKVARNYDIIHIHQASNFSADRKCRYIRKAKKLGKKVVLHMHGQTFMDYYNKQTDSKKKYLVDTINLSDAVIALSETWKKNLESIGIKNVYIVYNGLSDYEMEKLQKPFSSKSSSCDASEFGHGFLYLGRLGQRKGAYDLIQAINELYESGQSIHGIMAGDGSDRQQVIDKLNNKSLIEFPGWVEGDNKINLIRQCKYLILPSYNEGVPVQIIEAMAAGKPVITTNVGGIPDIVQEENGIIINPGDIEALKTAILALENNDTMCAQMGDNNREKAAGFTTAASKVKLDQIYRKILAEDEA